MAGHNHIADPKLIRLYIVELERQHKSDGTIVRRRQILERLAETTPLRTVSTEGIQQFLDRRDITARTRYHWISHLSNFYRWAVMEGHVDTDPTAKIIRPRLPTLLPRPIPTTDLALAIEMSGGVMESWLLLAAYAGLRCSEIAKLDVTDVLFADELLLVRGKGAKERLVPMHPHVVDNLSKRALPKAGPLFRRARGTRFPAAMVSREISIFLEGLEIKATAHSLRHWFGTHAYRSCTDLRVVQELMGHANPVTTTVYTRWSQESGRKAVSGL